MNLAVCLSHEYLLNHSFKLMPPDDIQCFEISSTQLQKYQVGRCTSSWVYINYMTFREVDLNRLSDVSRGAGWILLLRTSHGHLTNMVALSSTYVTIITFRTLSIVLSLNLKMFRKLDCLRRQVNAYSVGSNRSS